MLRRHNPVKIGKNGGFVFPWFHTSIPLCCIPGYNIVRSDGKRLLARVLTTVFIPPYGIQAGKQH